jgi:hypothetical protein
MVQQYRVREKGIGSAHWVSSQESKESSRQSEREPKHMLYNPAESSLFYYHLVSNGWTSEPCTTRLVVPS